MCTRDYWWKWSSCYKTCGLPNKNKPQACFS